MAGVKKAKKNNLNEAGRRAIASHYRGAADLEIQQGSMNGFLTEGNEGNEGVDLEIQQGSFFRGSQVVLGLAAACPPVLSAVGPA
jgi:hypothetical protein